MTVIHGRNGTGKTSLLEAVHYCALTRGLGGSTDRECLSFGKEHFTIRGGFISDRGSVTEVRIDYSPEKEKRIYVNDQEMTSFSRHVGSIPCVTFTPQELSIVTGAPAERRKFLDSSICQCDRRYMHELMTYRRVLQQRNALLACGIDHHGNLAGLDIWTEQLSMHAASIVRTRQLFLSRFIPIFKSVHALLPGDTEPAIIYHSTLGEIEHDSGIEEIGRRFTERFNQLRNQEIQRRQTLAGPHRDDLRLIAGGHDVRKFASQGQQRSYLIAMKIALRQYLYELMDEEPLSLLDDLFSELDEQIADRIVQTLEHCGQVLVTSTVERTGHGIVNYHMERNNKEQ